MKTKILILLTMIVMVSISLVSAATTEFVDPTPAEGSTVNWYTYDVNISNTGTDYHNVYDYDGSLLTFITFNDDDFSGTTALDISGNGNNCTGISGTTTQYSGQVATADNCVIASGPEYYMDAATDSLTICMAFNTTYTTPSEPVLWDTENSTNRANFFLNNGYPYSAGAGFSTGFLINDSVSYADGEWHTQCTVFDNENNIATLYMDGVIVATSPQTTSVGEYVNTDGFIIMDSFDASTSVDNFIIMKRALSQEEVQAYTDGVSNIYEEDIITPSSGTTTLKSYICDETNCSFETRTFTTTAPDGSEFDIIYPSQWGVYQRDAETTGDIHLLLDLNESMNMEYSWLVEDDWNDVTNLTFVAPSSLLTGANRYMNATNDFISSGYLGVYFDVDVTVPGKMFINFDNGENDLIKIDPEILETGTQYTFELDLQKISGDDCDVYFGAVFSSSFGDQGFKVTANDTEQHISEVITSSDPAYLSIGMLEVDNNGCNVSVDNFKIYEGLATEEYYVGSINDVSTGQGNLYLRNKDNNTQATVILDVGVGDVILVTGQSNAVPHFSNSYSSWTNISYRPTVISDGDWAELNTEASSYPYLASRIIDEENVPVGIVQTGYGGSQISRWIPGGDLYSRMIARVDGATGGLNKVKTILFYQGESDIAAGCDGNYTCYYNSGQSMVDSSQSDLTVTSGKTVFGQVNMVDYGELWPNAYWIQKASQDLWEKSNIVPGPYTYWIAQTTDGQHFQLENEAIPFMRMWANTVLDGIYNVGDLIGPELQSAEIKYDDSKTVVLTYDKPITQVGDYTYDTTGTVPKGFLFYDGGLERALVNTSETYTGNMFNDSNVTNVDIEGNTVYVTLDENINTSYYLTYGTLETANGKDVMLDDNYMPVLLAFNVSLTQQESPLTYSEDVYDGIGGVKTTAFAAFALIAVMILGAIAMLFIGIFNNGADLGQMMTVAIWAIGAAIVLMVGYIIISAVAGGLV